MQAQVKHVFLVCLASVTTQVTLSTLCHIAAIQNIDILLERLPNNKFSTAREITSRALREHFESTSRDHFESTSRDHFESTVQFKSTLMSLCHMFLRVSARTQVRACFLWCGGWSKIIGHKIEGETIGLLII